MKKISYTYQYGHIKIIIYPPYQQQVATKTINTTSSRRRNFSYFKCKKQIQQKTTKYCSERLKENEEYTISTEQWKSKPETKSRLTIH